MKIKSLLFHNSKSFHARESDFFSRYFSQQVDARCQLEIGIAGKSTSTTWYEIWEAATALAAVCVRAHEKGGKAYGLGDYTLLCKLAIDILEKLKF